jgi:hypothetical protein
LLDENLPIKNLNRAIGSLDKALMSEMNSIERGVGRRDFIELDISYLAYISLNGKNIKSLDYLSHGV